VPAKLAIIQEISSSVLELAGKEPTALIDDMSFGQPNAFGGGLAKGGTATLSINDQKVAEVRIE